MTDCKVVMEYLDGNINIRASNCSMVELATMCGALEQLMGVEAHKRGKSLDDIKDNMLDIHLAAMQQLTETIIAERSDSN